MLAAILSLAVTRMAKPDDIIELETTNDGIKPLK
jgi:hypothetical protein